MSKKGEWQKERLNNYTFDDGDFLVACDFNRIEKENTSDIESAEPADKANIITTHKEELEEDELEEDELPPRFRIYDKFGQVKWGDNTNYSHLEIQKAMLNYTVGFVKRGGKTLKSKRKRKKRKSKRTKRTR